MQQRTRRQGRARRAASARPAARRAEFIALSARAACGPRAKPRRRATGLKRLTFGLMLLLLLVPLLTEAPAQTPSDPPPGSAYWTRNAPLAHADPARSGYVDIELPVDALAVVWQVSGGASILAGPVMDEERVYTVDRNGVVTARWLSNGAINWTWDLGEEVAATPALAYGWLYVATLEGGVFAIERHTGKEMHRGDITKGAHAATLVAEARVFQGTDEGLLHVLDARTLDEVWRFDTATTHFVNGTIAVKDSNLKKPIRAAPAIHERANADNILLVAAHNGRTYALSVAGNVYNHPTLHWTATLGDTLHAAPVVDRTNQQVLIGTQDGRIVSLSLTTGAVKWSKHTAPAHVASIAVAGDTAIAISSDKGLIAMNATTGSERWAPLDPGGFLSSPILTKNAIVAVAGNGTLLIVSRTTGSTLAHPEIPEGLARWHLPGASHQTPAVTRAGIVVTDHAGSTTLIGPPPQLTADLRAQPIRMLGAPDANGTVDLDLRVENRGPHAAAAVLARLERGGAIVEEQRLGSLVPGAEHRWIPNVALGPGAHELHVHYEAIGASDPHPELAATSRTLSLAAPPTTQPSPSDATSTETSYGTRGTFTTGLANGFGVALIPGIIVGSAAGIALARWARARRARSEGPGGPDSTTTATTPT